MSEKRVKDYDKFVVRFPDGMRDAIAHMAKKDGRSMNAEIITLLELAIKVCVDFAPENGSFQEQFEKRLDKINEDQARLEKDMALTQKEIDKIVKGVTDSVLKSILREYDLTPKSNIEPTDVQPKKPA
ncbi:Arc family DNA-binding protein [Cronobacter dublinensis]|nr:Arc family DNA-binding protein [Cronobacter dublinensis]